MSAEPSSCAPTLAARFLTTNGVTELANTLFTDTPTTINEGELNASLDGFSHDARQ